MPSVTKTSKKSQHAVWIEINSERLLKNLAALKAGLKQECAIMAIVKANAYGHGLTQTAKILAPEVDYLGVTSLREALELKDQGIHSSIFILGRLLEDELPAALMDGVTLGISSYEEALSISNLSASLARVTPIHIKVDTGMGRLGIPFRNAMALIQRISKLPHLDLEGIYTHLPTAESDDGFAERQLNDFALLIEALRQKEIVFRYRHATNSAGTLKRYHPSLNMIRPGLSLYGVYPHVAIRDLIELKPVLALKSRVTFVKYLKHGESVGYGRDFVAERETTLGIVPVGYSHGYPFRASSEGSVLYQGVRYPLAGRVSMDFLAVNFGNQEIDVGAEVTLIGEEGTSSIQVEEVAQWAGTIPYEILTGLLPNIPRFFS